MMKIIPFLSFLLAVHPVAARTFESKPSAPGASQEQFELLANALQPGDELIVHAGTYSQDGRRAVTIKGTPERPIVIRAVDGDAPLFIADPLNNCIEFIDCAHLVIRGLRFRGGSSGVRFVRGEHVTFEDCEISETQNNALTMNSGNCHAFIVRRNHIHHTGLNTSRPTEGEGMYIGCHDGSCRTTDSIFESNYVHHTRGTSDGGNDGIEIKAGSYGNIVRNNVIHDTNIDRKYPGIFVYGGGPGTNVVEGNVIWNAGEGIQVVSDAVVRNNIIFHSESTGITAAPHAAMPQVRNVTIVNNTVFNAPVGVRLRWAQSTNAIFANNAVYCPSGFAVVAEIGSALLRRNFIHGVIRGTAIEETHLLSGGVPQIAFVDATKNDFWPREGSALIGAADATLASQFDFNGKKRLPPFDVGAYETDGHSENVGWRIEPGFRPSDSTTSASQVAAPAAPGSADEPVRLRVDFAKPDGRWDMPALALGQGGLQSDPMIEPHIKEVRQLRPRTIRLFLSEYYRIYPARDRYDWTRLDRELRAVRATGARPVLALAMKPPQLYPKVDHFIVHPNNYDEWERLCEALARHCREEQFNVAGWEVCNEPDIGEMGGTPHYFKKATDYNQLYTHTVRALLRGDPDAQVGGPAVASADSFLVEGLIGHCATNNVPLHLLSWHLYSDSPSAHARNIAKQRERLARFPQLKNVKLFISEWNMDLMRPNLAPGFQPCFVLETMRRFAEEKLDMAAYYHIRDCFVDPADFDWMSPGGRRFMAHWWNTMPQYSALFDHNGRVRPAWYAFRLLGQLDGPRYNVQGETGNLRAIAGEGDGYKHILLWRYEGDGPDEIELRLEVDGVTGRNCRIVALDSNAPVNNIRVVHFGRSDQLADLSINLKPWDIRWIEIE